MTWRRIDCCNQVLLKPSLPLRAESGQNVSTDVLWPESHKHVFSQTGEDLKKEGSFF